jgi:general stress protein 26
LEGAAGMNQELAKRKGLELIQRSKIAMIGSLDEKGYPNIKAMLNLQYEGMKIIWFSTNTSSKRVQQIRKEAKTSVYYVDQDRFSGLLLLGRMEVCTDEESRKALWFEGSERYYPQGINDPDYCVFRFVAEKGNYYEGLCNISFPIE